MLNIFGYCTGLTSVNIPNSVTSIYFSAFSGCTGLMSVTIGNGVTDIGDNAFEGCSGLTSVTIGKSVTTIGRWAFKGCSGLTSISIPNSVTTIGYSAFMNCSGLTSVTIGDGVIIIGGGAFMNCSGLTSVTIPNSVTSIGDGAFDGWDLPIVISKIENPFIIKGKSKYDRTFSLNTFNNATLYVPVGTIDKYKSTGGWKDFANIVDGSSSGVSSIESEETNEISRYSLEGRVIKNSHKGITVIQMNNGTTKKVVVK